MTRRRLLAGLVALLAGLMLLLAARGQRWLSWLVDALRPRLDPHAPTGPLSPEEMAAVVAFAEILVEGRPLSLVERGYVVEHVDERVRTQPGYLALYRASAAELDRVAATRFAPLSSETRLGVVLRHRLVVSDVRRRELFGLTRRSALALRALAVPDLLWGYYLSPAGWAVVGYATFPSRCADLVRYTMREP
jgi:hypothetical protein